MQPLKPPSLPAWLLLAAVFTSVPAPATALLLAGPVAIDIGTASTSVAIADVTGDGMPDLIVAAGTIFVLPGHGDGTYGSRLDTGVAGQAFAIGDLNGDGRPDIAVANSTGFLQALLSN